MSRHPLDPLHERPVRVSSPVKPAPEQCSEVLREAASPSVVDLQRRADALTSGTMSATLCQAKDDHPQEDDHHYLEPDQVAPEPSMESLREIQSDTTGKATLIILKGEGTKEIESEPVLRVQSSLVHGTISSSKDHGIFGDGAMGSYPEPITGTRGTELSPRVEGAHVVDGHGHSDKTHLGTEESDARLAAMQASYPSHSSNVAHKIRASTAGGPGSHVSDSVAVVPPPEAIVVSKVSSYNDRDQPPSGGGHNDETDQKHSNLHRRGAVKQYESGRHSSERPTTHEEGVSSPERRGEETSPITIQTVHEGLLHNC